MTDFNRMRATAVHIVNVVEQKDKDYGSSWKKRGGAGAFMVMARKWDRIENLVQKDKWDIFDALMKDRGGIRDDVQDLIGYLHLILDEIGLENLPMPEAFGGTVREPESIHPRNRGFVQQDGDAMFNAEGYVGDGTIEFKCRQCNGRVSAKNVLDAHRIHSSCPGLQTTRDPVPAILAPEEGDATAGYVNQDRP